MCKSAPRSSQTDNHASTPLLSFLQAGCPSCRQTNSVKALKAQQLKSGKTEKLKIKKTNMLRSISKQSWKSIDSVLMKKTKATVGRICRKKKVLSLECKSERVMKYQ